MNHPRVPGHALALLAMLVVHGAVAAPNITPGAIVDVCASPCTPVGGVGLSGNRIGILVDDTGAATWIVLDRDSGAEMSSTVLGASAGFEMQDVASDGAGGAWMVGFSDSAGISTPGRWHSDDLTTRQTPLGPNGETDLLLTAVATDGTAFGVSATDIATRILPDGTPVDMAAGLVAELPTSISDSTADGNFAAGVAQASGVLALAGWDGDTLSYQDIVAGGNGVIGRREDGTLVIVGIRIPAAGASPRRQIPHLRREASPWSPPRRRPVAMCFPVRSSPAAGAFSGRLQQAPRGAGHLPSAHATRQAPHHRARSRRP